jgi:hypothetical protein
MKFFSLQSSNINTYVLLHARWHWLFGAPNSSLTILKVPTKKLSLNIYVTENFFVVDYAVSHFFWYRGLCIRHFSGTDLLVRLQPLYHSALWICVKGLKPLMCQRCAELLPWRKSASLLSVRGIIIQSHPFSYVAKSIWINRHGHNATYCCWLPNKSVIMERRNYGSVVSVHSII